jgi:hypothetical protein
MVYHLKVVESSARRVSLELAEPPCPSHLVKPPLLPDQEGGVTVSDGIVSSSSGDGFLLQFVDAHVKTDEAAMLCCGVAPSRVLIDAFMNSDVTRFVCIPISGQLFRLPDIDGTKKSISWSKMGILTQSEHPHEPPARYAVAELKGDHYSEFVMRRFLSQSQTGDWDTLLSLSSPLPARLRDGCSA